MPFQHAFHLLRQAAAHYDAHPALQHAAQQGAASAFDGGAFWMQAGLDSLRGVPTSTLPNHPWQLWGCFKYGACSIATTFIIALLYTTDLLWFLPIIVLPFYVVEAQMVFLFPLLLDGTKHPLQASRQWTTMAGGTVRVMLTVLPLAATMLFGGLFGRGFVRSWCLGCLAVLLWYEELRTAKLPHRSWLNSEA